MSKNFRVRLVCSVAMLATAIVAMYAFEGVPLKILVTLFVLLAAVELFSFLKKSRKAGDVVLLICEFGFLACGVIFAYRLSVMDVWAIILGVCGYDIFAYLGGQFFGGKIFKKSRPFPKISKGKTWEGTIFGIAVSVCLVFIFLHFSGGLFSGIPGMEMVDGVSTGASGTLSGFWGGTNGFSGGPAIMYLLCGPLALIGDLFESHLKRRFGVKDSNEIVEKNPVMEKIELIIGGKNGHGGFLDRVDSLAFTATVLLVISSIVAVVIA